MRRVDRVRNAIIRERCGYELSVLERIERSASKWFGHVERMGEEKLVKGVSVKYGGYQWRGRSQRRGRDEVKELLIGRG